MNGSEISCEGRIDGELRVSISDLTRLWHAYKAGTESEDDSLCEYGLAFDYVAEGTFPDQREGYFRYQLSWGGPSDEFRFFVNPGLSCHRVEYWFMDWFDGAHRKLSGSDEALLRELWLWFVDTGAAEAALAGSRKARGDDGRG